jgi:phosphatidylserine/phosphatidylglycerophosphate/cardiolipin synthase-like enzyme
MSNPWQVSGKNTAALFTLKVHRGEGMALLAMNWKKGKPPDNFVGFAIEYKEPNGTQFFPLKNRLAFRKIDGTFNPNELSTRLSPIQKFRWVHFPRNADLLGAFTYQVTPVFMDSVDVLSYGDAQQAAIVLQSETFPDELNIGFARGFVSSQAFVDRYQKNGAISKLLPASAKTSLDFVPTHPDANEALAWMGFEARRLILAVLDDAIADSTAQVRVIAYDLNEPQVVDRLVKLGSRLRVIIDNSGDHGAGSSETAAEARLVQSAGAANVKRQKMLGLQHNKTIVVKGKKKKVVCGSTNFSWRGFYVQANNAVVMEGKKAVDLYSAAFESYWSLDPHGFGGTDSAKWADLGLSDVKAQVAFSPHSPSNVLLQTIADDIANGTKSSLLYSLAFLYETPGPILDAIKKMMLSPDRFVYGISDKRVGGLDVQTPNGNVTPVFPSALGKDAPKPFSQEPTAGTVGTRMHHKFVVIDADKPSARVYLGSYNFSGAADTLNGENLLLIKNQRVATAYMIEAVRLFDHYEFRVLEDKATTANKELVLRKPPRQAGEKPWWDTAYTDPRKIRDRELFS